MSVGGRLEGKVALVTVAGRGIGAVLARGLAAEGAVVHLVDLDDPAEALAELPSAGRAGSHWDDPSYIEAWAPVIPLGRIAEPEEMVGPAVFLASDESAHVTGQLFYVDGGWSASGNFPASYVDRTKPTGDSG